jgi:hypothetical protein
MQKTVRQLPGKPREAPQKVLRYLCLLLALALAKASSEATRLFGLAGFFQWKAEKSPNKQALIWPVAGSR